MQIPTYNFVTNPQFTPGEYRHKSIGGVSEQGLFFESALHWL